MTDLHFEDLWSEAESYHQANSKEDIQTVLDALILKINLYKTLSDQKDYPAKELAKIKSRTLGEILFTISNISLQDNINVYEALGIALRYRDGSAPQL